MFFKNRVEAGKLLSKKLLHYQQAKDTIVLGLPRGGVVLASEVALALKLPLDIICPRKIGAPFNPELAIGAITENGEGYFDKKLMSYFGISKDYLEEKITQEIQEAKRRLKVYRNDRPPLQLKDKTIILVDDGIATGATVKAAILALKKEDVKKIIVATPVSSLEAYQDIHQQVDEIICLSLPAHFQAVGQFYEHFNATTDQEVCTLLKNNRTP